MGLGQVDIGDRLAEIIFGRRRHPEIARAHIDAVVIHFEDLVLGVVAVEPDRQERLLDLAVERPLRRQEQVLGELLGDGGTALQARIALRIRNHGAQRAPDVDAEMIVEAPVLRGERRLDEIVRQLVERIGIVSPYAALADLVAVFVEERDGEVFRLVELAGIDDPEGRQGKPRHEHRADRRKAHQVRQQLDEKPFESRHMEHGHDVVELCVAGPERVPELIEESIEPGIGAEHPVALGALLLLVERILHR